MNFEVRYQDFTFKHTYSEKPDLSEERFKEHFHTVYELLYFVQGNADFMIEHRLYKIKPGSLLIAKPGEYHNIVFHSEEPYERYVLRFPPYAIHRYVRLQLERTHSVYNVEDSLLAEEFHNDGFIVPAAAPRIALLLPVIGKLVLEAVVEALLEKAEFVP